MAKILDIADAVVTSVNGATLVVPSPFTAVRSIVPEYTLEDLDTLRVTVVPKSFRTERLTRGDGLRTYEIDIAIHKRIDDVDSTSLDPYVTFTQAILSHLEGTSMAGAAWIDIANAPIYDTEFLREKHTFLSVITVTYQGRG